MTKFQFKRWAQANVRSWIDPDCSLEEEWEKLIAFLKEDKTPLEVVSKSEMKRLREMGERSGASAASKAATEGSTPSSPAISISAVRHSAFIKRGDEDAW